MVFSLVRSRDSRIPQEAIIGITYAVAAAAHRVLAGTTDTTTIKETFIEAAEQVEAAGGEPTADEERKARGLEEVVTDKGYHSGALLEDWGEIGVRGPTFPSRSEGSGSGTAREASRRRPMGIGGASGASGANNSCAGGESSSNERLRMSTTRAE